MTMLSDHFSLAELTATEHTQVDNSPPPEVIARLTSLAADYLEVVRAHFGPLVITSGYRSPALNLIDKGSKTSSHCFGCAADFHAESGAGITDLVAWIRDHSGLDYDQVIDEYKGDSRWCHLGITSPLHPLPRKMAMVFRRGIYTPI